MRSVSIDENEALMLVEFNHRLSNTFQMISSHIERCKQVNTCRSVGPLLATLDARMRSLVAMHRLLAEDRGHSLEDYIRWLCVQLVGAFDRRQLMPFVTAEELPLTRDVSHKIALMIVELVTNVLKHGAADDREGMIRVAVKKIGICIEIEVYDSSEMPIDNAVPSGMVLRIARSLSGDVWVAGRPGYIAIVRIPWAAGPRLA